MAKGDGRGCRAGADPPWPRGLRVESQRSLLATAHTEWDGAGAAVPAPGALRQPPGQPRQGVRDHAFIQPGKTQLVHLLLTQGPRALGKMASAADAGLFWEPWSSLSPWKPPCSPQVGDEGIGLCSAWPVWFVCCRALAVPNRGGSWAAPCRLHPDPPASPRGLHQQNQFWCRGF